jgi:hypothetical protein
LFTVHAKYEDLKLNISVAVAFFGDCDSLQELADKMPMIFMFQIPDYPVFNWLLGCSCVD